MPCVSSGYRIAGVEDGTRANFPSMSWYPHARCQSQTQRIRWGSGEVTCPPFPDTILMFCVAISILTQCADIVAIGH
eukprot:463656-Rhodomonas_salina.5